MMGFVLSILYLVIYYLTPAYLLGPLADAHIEVVIAALIILVSVPALMKSFLWKNSQSLALIGLAIAVFLSVVVESHWVGGGVQALLNFIPNCMAFFMVSLHVTTKRRLKIVILMLLAVCLINIAHGVTDLRRGIAQNNSTPYRDDGSQARLGATASPYLLQQQNDSGETTYRVQGLGEINDPNDFGQLMVCLIPLLFIFWRQNKTIKNIVFVFLPVGVLLLGVFLTHSRGALVALTLIAVVAARRRIGTLPAILLAGGMFVVAMALRFTGGRGISASGGEDRTGLWGEGMQIVRAHPLLGVGYGDLWEHTEGYLTAHNSVVVCAAELGMVGLFFWSLYIFSTMRDAAALASPEKVGDGEPIVIEGGPLSYAALPPEGIDKKEINQMGWAMVLSLLGFLAAGWFLSRAFVATLFLLGGLTEAIYEMAARRGMIAPRLKLARVILYSGVLAFALLLIVYVMIRVLNLMH